MIDILKIGDSVGAIHQMTKNGVKQWTLQEDKIDKIVETKSGKKYHTKSKFHPLDAEDIDGNTEIQETAEKFILVREVFWLNDITKPKAENWIKWANENMDKAVSVLADR